MLHLIAGDDWLHVERRGRDLPAHLAGNLELHVEASMFTYRAAETCLVWRESWLRFLDQMRLLVRERRCHASLWGAMPDELCLHFHAAPDRSTVTGFLARHGNNHLTFRLQFGLEFDSGRLAGVLEDLEKISL